MALRVLNQWLAHGDASEGDWAGHILRLANRGALGRAGALLLDLAALTQPFSCKPGECTPGRRERGARSCCADIDVSLSPRERNAIARALPRLAMFLRRKDPRWAGGAPPTFEGEELRRDGGRCVFGVLAAEGLRCGLHRYEVREGLPVGTLKPIPCRLFPLVLVDLGDGQRLLTAVHRSTEAQLETFPARRFPCLGNDSKRPPLYRAMRGTIEALLGAKAYAGTRAAARSYRGRSPKR